MNLTFRTLDIEGFKAILDPLQIRLDVPGLHFVQGINELDPQMGANGVAKSTLWDALSWCLWGRTVAGLRNPDIAPWEQWGYNGPTMVSLKLSCNERNVTINRTANPNRLTLSNQDVGQENIDTLLGIGFDCFRHTILFGQGQPLFLDLKPEKKMELFADVLNLGRWDERADRASTTVTSLSHTLADLAGELRATEQRREGLEQSLQQATQRHQQWRDEQANRLATIAHELTTLREQFEIIQRNRDAADLALDNAGTELIALDNQIRLGRTELDEMRTMLDMESEQRARIQAQHDEVYRELSRLGDGNNCPVCGQSITRTTLARHKAERKKQLDRLATKLQDDPAAALRSHATGLAASIATMEEAQSAFRRKANEAQDTLNRIGPRHAEVETRIRMLERSRGEDEQQENPHQSTLSNLRTELAQVHRNLADIKERHGRAERRLSRTKFWTKGFRDIRLQEIEDVLSELEFATTAELDRIGLLNWQISYAIEKETARGTIKRGINVSVLSPDNLKPVRWEAWSGGEAQRLRLIGALGLGDTLLARAGITSNIVVLDEPSRGLSDEGMANLIDVLADRAEERGQSIFLTDHLARQSARFASTVTLRKTDRGAVLNTG